MDLDEVTRGEGRGGTESKNSRRFQSALIVGQIGLSTVLLLAAGLFVASFRRIAQVDPGFGSPERVLSVRISVQPPKYTPWEGFRRFFTEVERELAAIPGAQASALSFNNPMEPGSAFQVGFEIDGVIETENAADRPLAAIWPVSPGFFQTINLPLVHGRSFTSADKKTAPGVVIVNEAFVHRYLPSNDPLGLQLLKTQFWDEGYPAVHEIVGVVGDMKSDGLRSPPYPVMFFPYDQTPFGNMRALVRAKVVTPALVAGLRDAVWRIDSDIPMERLQPLDQAIGQSLAGDRFSASIASLFATIALGLSAIGLFGVMSNAVAARTREFGIRRALGAKRSGIVRGVLAETFRTSVLGWALGVGAFVVISPAIAGSLFATAPTDPATLIAVGVILIATAVAAGTLPARRASGVEPAQAMGGSPQPNTRTRSRSP